MRTVVLICADGEWRAVRGLVPHGRSMPGPVGEYIEGAVPGHDVVLFRAGWGRVSSAAATQFVIDRWQPDLLINLGTCGGFEGRVERGKILLVERTIIYDIVEQMTDPEEAIGHYSTSLDLGWLPDVLPTPIIRALLVSGDRDIVACDIPVLISKYGAVAADWESGAIAWVAARNHVKLLILRGVSDLVGISGGEAYGDYEFFLARTHEIMARLIGDLPLWLRAIMQENSASDSGGVLRTGTD